MDGIESKLLETIKDQRFLRKPDIPLQYSSIVPLVSVVPLFQILYQIMLCLRWEMKGEGLSLLAEFYEESV